MIGFEPGFEEEEPVAFAFVEEDEGFGAHAVTDGVAGGDGSAFFGSGAGAAGVAFFGFGGGICESLIVGNHDF